MIGYLAYEPYRAGVNNVRMNFEIVAALAHAMGRTLAIPEAKVSRDCEGFVDGVYFPYHPAMFLNTLGVDWVGEEAIPKGLSTYEVPPVPNRDSAAFCLEDGPDRDAFLAGRKPIWLDGNIAKADVIRLPEVIAPFYAQVYASEDGRRRMARFVREKVRHPPVAELIAQQCADKLGMFHAVVIRRADFLYQYWQANIRPDDIVRVLAEEVPNRATLMVATDEPLREMFAPLAERWHVVYARDLVLEAAPWLLKPLIGCVEQNLLALGQTFTGTFLSTFSSYVDRLRGYRGSWQRPRFTDGSHNKVNDDDASLQFSWQPFMAQSTAIWGREFREGVDWSV